MFWGGWAQSERSQNWLRFRTFEYQKVFISSTMGSKINLNYIGFSQIILEKFARNQRANVVQTTFLKIFSY